MSSRAMSSAHGRETVSGLSMGSAMFAGVLMIMVGIFHIIAGLAAVIDDEFFVVTNQYAFEVDTTTWGWIHMGAGTIVALAGFAVLTGHLWARILAIIVALGSAIANFFWIPYYPFWSILIIAIDVVIIWGLATYGRGDAYEETV
ncbi:MAG: DUF7144 family membrane protein [Tepidiformaceae bacterium]